jgi:UPF0176 protein
MPPPVDRDRPKMPVMSALRYIAVYRFVDIDEPAALRDRLFESAQAAGLKGTVLIAAEGLNGMLAGPAPGVRRWLADLQADPRFATLELKQHAIDRLPFQRLRVKVKAEIIRMNQPSIRPGAARAGAVDATTLERWLAAGHCDAGRELVLLDTRNAFEVEAGGFVGALDWGLARFSDFPAALAEHRGQLEGKTVVSYCTGGIRCEKAALWMAAQGLPNVLQLDGGILRWLERHPRSPHWRGDCVVFDERATVRADDVAPQLSP